MKVGIIGTGYVGLPTGVGLAELGHDVVCIDAVQAKIDALNAGKIIIFEEGLEDLFQKNRKSGKLKFTSDMQEGVKGADIVVIAVGTPPHPETKEADMKYIHAAAKELAKYLTGYTVVANKSTVPVGTGDVVEEMIRQENPSADFDVVSLPEFLREGFAVYDFFNPDRIVVGANTQKAMDVIKDLYAPFEDKAKMLYVNRRSSETIKYASNAFLAMKIHYINEMANFCEKSGADVYEVAKGMGMDTRIGNKFLNPGPGYGGSCFPKDTNAMAYMGRAYGVEMSLIETTIKKNDARKVEMAKRVLDAVEGVENPKVAVLGLAFKGGTDDCRASPAMEIVTELLNHPVQITAYDPKAMETAQKELGDKIAYASDAYEAAQGADILAILTEWEDFKRLDLDRIKAALNRPKIVDLRNILNKEEVEQAGFDYRSIGRAFIPTFCD